MWKKVYSETVDGFTIEVNKDFRLRKAVYSSKLGVLRNDGVLPFFDPEKLTSSIVIELLIAASAFVANDRAKDAADEQRRVEELAGKGNNRNPTANTGLSRFKNKNKPVNANK